MTINRDLLLEAPGTGSAGWNWRHSYAVLAELSYWPDLNWDNRWADVFGFATSKTIVTPGRILPNYVRVIHPDVCIFSIAGTTDWLQMLDNVIYSGHEQDTAFGPGWVHSYFLWCAKSLAPMIAADLAVVPANTPICFTGHSLGGAIAQLLACYFERNSTHPVRQCVVFCSPKVGNAEWTEQTHGFTYSHFFNDRDWVVNLPPRLMVTAPTEFAGITSRFASFVFKRPAYYLVPGRFQSYAAFGIVPFTGELLEWPFRAVGSMIGSDTRGTLATHEWLQAHKLRTLLDIMRPYTTKWENDPGFADIRLLDINLRNSPLPDNPDGEGVPGQSNAPVENFLPPSPPPAPYPTPLPIAGPTPPQILVSMTQALEIGAATRGFTAFGETEPPPFLPPGNVDYVFQGGERFDWLFKGKDRRLVEKIAGVIEAIEARDRLVFEGDPSAALSNRTPIIDPTVEGLAEAWRHVKDAVVEQLYTERS